MANELTRVGYGIVEPNHLSAQRTGQIYAQLPCASGITVLENGMFVKYDYATNGGECNFTGAGEWMLVMNEVKLYDVRQTLADFALLASEAVDGVITPRVYKTNVGDIITTNCVHQDSASLAVVGAILCVGSDGLLTVASPAEGEMSWQVVKVTTMPDGQTGVKIMRLPDHAAA